MEHSRKKNIILFVVFGLSFIIGLVFLFTPYITEMPDGFEKIAEEHQAMVKKEDTNPLQTAPLSDYVLPGIRDVNNARRYAGAIGVVTVFGITILIAYLLKRRRKRPSR